MGGTPSKGGGWRQKRQALLRSASGNSSSMATPEDVDSNYAALEAVRKGMREVYLTPPLVPLLLQTGTTPNIC